jgi:putative membrane protein
MTFKKWLILIFVLALVASGINPRDFFTWMLEVAPAVIGIIVLIATDKKFQFSRFIYVLMLVHAIVLMIGGHYTYAEVPFFNWLRDIGLFSRNNYDKVGHLMQGFVPVLVARELFIRLAVIRGRAWTNFLAVCMAMAISAVYELIEWLVSLLSGSAGDSFLGTQGYIWDTQSDMWYCLIGALIGAYLVGRYQDRKIGEKILP